MAAGRAIIWDGGAVHPWWIGWFSLALAGSGVVTTR